MMTCGSAEVDFPIVNDRENPGSVNGKSVVSPRKCLYLPRLMPKPIARSKTRKAVAKRFKITATGKVLRSHASRRHLLSSKNAKKKRQLAKSALVDKTDVQRIKANLPFA